jgi:hypothetical protein
LGARSGDAGRNSGRRSGFPGTHTGLDMAAAKHPPVGHAPAARSRSKANRQRWPPRRLSRWATRGMIPHPRVRLASAVAASPRSLRRRDSRRVVFSVIIVGIFCLVRRFRRNHTGRSDSGEIPVAPSVAGGETLTTASRMTAH